jgi:hypothetical protein
MPSYAPNILPILSFTLHLFLLGSEVLEGERRWHWWSQDEAHRE